MSQLWKAYLKVQCRTLFEKDGNFRRSYKHKVSFCQLVFNVI